MIVNKSMLPRETKVVSNLLILEDLLCLVEFCKIFIKFHKIIIVEDGPSNKVAEFNEVAYGSNHLWWDITNNGW